MQPVNLNSALPGLPMLNPRPASRLGLLLDALQPTPGQSVATTRGTEATQRVAAEPAPLLPTNQKAVEAASPTRLSEAGLMLAQMGMKPRTPLELILRFSAAASAPDPAANGDIEAGLMNESGAANAAAPTGRLAEVDSRQLAQQLRNVITRSGLFYESHVHEWIQGRRSLAELQQEPQQRWQSDRQSPPANDASWGSESAGRTQMQGSTLHAEAGNSRAANDAAYVSHTRDAASGGQSGNAQPVPPALEDIVARQLDVLATRQLHLHLLPGQDAPVSLMIAQEQEGNAATGMQAWVTEIECTLPELGTVHARLRLLGDQLAVTVRAADGTRADWLDAQLGELRKLLERSGLSPAVLEVRHEP